MSPAEIDRMLEWARRTAEGGRIIAPPGDNLKELLDRIDKADPGNAQAEALKQRTTHDAGRKGTLALKKRQLDEAERRFPGAGGAQARRRLGQGAAGAHADACASQRSLGKRKFQAALADATAALEMAPEDTSIAADARRRAPGDGQARAGGRGVSARPRRQAARQARQARAAEGVGAEAEGRRWRRRQKEKGTLSAAYKSALR